MKTTYPLICAGIILTAVMSTSAQEREWWGAYAEGGEYWGDGEAYGAVWNFANMEATIEGAVEMCMKRPQCAKHGVHKIRVFSSSARVGSEGYKEFSYGRWDAVLLHGRCIAVEGSAGDYQVRVGDSERDAIESFGEEYRDTIVDVHCNEE